MHEKFLQELKGIYTKLGGEEDLSSENSLIVILDKIYKQMGGEKDLKRFSIPEVIDLIEDEVHQGGGSSNFSTVEVTLNIIPPEGVTFVKETVSSAISYPSTVFNYDGDYYSCAYLKTSNHKVTMLLYNGVCYIDGLECRSEDDTYWPLLSSATVSGDISWDESIGDVGAMVVTGSGTITVSEYTM